MTLIQSQPLLYQLKTISLTTCETI